MTSDESLFDFWLFPYMEIPGDHHFHSEGSLTSLTPTPLALCQAPKVPYPAHGVEPSTTSKYHYHQEEEFAAPRHLSLDSEQAAPLESSALDVAPFVMDLSSTACPKIAVKAGENRSRKRPMGSDLLELKAQPLEKYPRLPAPTAAFGTDASAVLHAPDLADQHMCRVCLKFFPTVNQMRRHQAVDHSMKLYPCSKCDDSFCLKSTLQIHKHALHRYLCYQCGKTFTRPRKLAEHAESSHGTYVCDLCFQPFSLKVVLEEHKMKGHRQYKI